MDNCLSVYFLHLSHAMPYALDLLDTAHWYRQHQRLMAHWQALYGADIHTVDYDAFVPTPNRRHGACWTSAGWPGTPPACISIARAMSCRRPAFGKCDSHCTSHASGRWRHYERHLDGLRQALNERPCPETAHEPD